jgi:ABC-type lipoprotein export system ATPase subunit
VTSHLSATGRRAPGDPDDAVLVRCVRVGRTYGRGSAEVTALTEVTCTIGQGDRVALTGPSGSGKSTLLHLVAGLDQPTSGMISWPGLRGSPPGGGLVGVIFQGPSLLPALDAAENVALPLLLGGASGAEAIARGRQALERLGIAGLAGKLPEEMSGGQSQRVAAARVLAARPRLILADEPTGQLDHEAGELLISLLLEAADETGAALVVSTHDPAIAVGLAQRWTMRDGRLVKGSPPEDGARE